MHTRSHRQMRRPSKDQETVKKRRYINVFYSTQVKPCPPINRLAILWYPEVMASDFGKKK